MIIAVKSRFKHIKKNKRTCTLYLLQLVRHFSQISKYFRAQNFDAMQNREINRKRIIEIEYDSDTMKMIKVKSSEK